MLVYKRVSGQIPLISHHGHKWPWLLPRCRPCEASQRCFFLVLQEAGEPEPGKKMMWEIDVEILGKSNFEIIQVISLV